MRKLDHFSAAIFDMDGLLIDSERLALAAFERASAFYQLGDIRDVFMRCIGTNKNMGMQVLTEGLGDRIDPQVFSETWHDYYREATTSAPVPLKAGVHELLSYLSELGLPTAVATSTQTPAALTKLTDSGIIQYFDVIIGGDQVDKSKPEPDIYLQAAATLSAEPTQCVAFEDSTNGVLSASSAGMTVVQIPDLAPSHASLATLGHIVLPSLVDVLDYDFTT